MFGLNESTQYIIEVSSFTRWLKITSKPPVEILERHVLILL